ncbi:uncharacterized protein LOC144168417 [Haemaphysalis longicornis]
MTTPAIAAAVAPQLTQLRPPPPFDFDNPGSWTTWLLQYEDYTFATGHYTAPPEVQVRSMLYCMGPQARVVLATTPLGDSELKDVAAVKKAFTDHFIHPPNELYETARFHRRAQEPGETADAFYTALRSMVKRCNYASPEVEERLVRDRFVVGLLDRNLSDKLCRSPKLTLQEGLTHVRQHEDAENERRARDSADSSPLAVDAAARVRNAKGKPGSPDRPNQRGCFFCGRSSHERADCPARQATCNFCSKKGHFETVCMKNRRCNSKRTRSSASSVELHAVAENRPNAKFIEVLVNGSPLSFKVDSGAEVSVVPSSFSGVPPKLQVPEGELKGPGSQESSGELLLDPGLFEGLGTLPDAYTIRLKPGATPFSLSAPRRLPLPLHEPIKKKLDKMESEGVIRRVDAPTEWCAGLVAVPKGDGDCRICSQLYTTFITPIGRYCFLRLPFGITSAPEYFQKQMSRILEGQTGVVNMIDDILVFGKTRKEHDQRLQQVLARLSKAGITLNRDKCSFGTNSVKFLGVVVSAHGISPHPDKVAAIKRLPAPEDLSGKNSEWTWGPSQQSAFGKLKELLCSEQCVATYNTQYKTTVSADASSFGLGAVFLQEQPSGERRAVAFASRSLTAAETRYSQTEKEALAASWAVQRFDQYVRGLDFILETDHKPLVALLGNLEIDLLPPRIQRFRLKLMSYQYKVLYVPGKLLATADTLSRAPVDVPSSQKADQVELYVQELVRSIPGLVSTRWDDLRQAQASDGECDLLVEYCTKGWPRQSRLPLHLKKYWQHRGDLSVCDGLLLKNTRIVIPTSLQQ